MDKALIGALITGGLSLLAVLGAAVIAAAVNIALAAGKTALEERDRRIAELEEEIDRRIAWEGRLTDALRYWIRRECQDPTVWLDTENPVHAQIKMLQDAV